MKVINIDPIMKELEEAMNQSIFETDVSTCFIACALRKKLQECPQIDLDTESIEARFREVVTNEPDELHALNNLEVIYDYIINALKKIENQGE